LPPSKLQRFKEFSEHFNVAEVEYRRDSQLQEAEFDSLEKWYARVDDGRRRFIPFLRSQCGVKFSGRVLEIAAGSGWMSAEMSRITEVTEVFTLDASETLLQEITPNIFNYLQAQEDKITRVLGDFHRLDFKDESFDLVTVDAGLHHAVSLDAVLAEVFRVLKPGGQHVAIREMITPPLWFKRTSSTRRRLIAAGVTENMYPMKEWRAAFEKAGFSFRARRVNLKTNWLARLNEWLFNGLFHCRYVLLGAKQEGGSIS
jgi:ubiquinone/menaquinone biosynthesis C-methylase UbiE